MAQIMTAETPQKCTERFTAALVARDMDVALALLTDDVVLFYSNGSTISGKNAFREVMTANWAIVEDYKYASANMTWVSQSDSSAAVVYSFAWSGKARGKDVSGTGRATRVLRNQSKSGWQIAHEHLSGGEPPTSA
jgi:ketosteroid isomerase-like protein